MHYSFRCVDSLTSLLTNVTLKMQETCPAVKSSYPIRLESLPITNAAHSSQGTKPPVQQTGVLPTEGPTDILNASCEYFIKRLVHFISS